MLKLEDPLPAWSEQDLSDLAAAKISYMEIFRFDCKLIKDRLQDSFVPCHCGLLKISCRQAIGFAEYILPDFKSNSDLIRWASVYMKLKGLSIPEAILCVQEKAEAWGAIRAGLAKSALTELEANIRNPLPPVKAAIRSLDRNYLIERSEAYFAF
jgi:hypothetical protein